MNREKRMMKRLIINGWIILPINTQRSATLRKKLSKKSLQCQGKEWNFRWFIVEWFLKSINLCKISLSIRSLWRNDVWCEMIFLKLTQVEMDDKKRNERRKKIDGWSLWKMKYKWKLRNNDFSTFTKWCMAQFWRELNEHFYITCNKSPTFWLKPGIHKLFSLTSLESSAFLSNFFAILFLSLFLTWLHRRLRAASQESEVVKKSCSNDLSSSMVAIWTWQLNVF